MYPLQVKDVLFEPVRKTQDAMFFINTPNDMWVPCGPKQPGAVQISMQDLAGKGLASKVWIDPQTLVHVENIVCASPDFDLSGCCCSFALSMLLFSGAIGHLMKMK